MTKTKTYSDVFLSQGGENAALAAEIVRVLQSYGLQVFTDAQIKIASNIEDAVWEAIAESQALVIIISESAVGAWVAFELGAARAWNKPVYGVSASPTSPHMPDVFHGMAVYPPSRIQEIAQEITRSSRTLSDAETKVLIEEYLRAGIPVDQFALQPAKLSALTKRFNKRAKRQVTGEQILRMLFRIRKAGALGTTPRKQDRRATLR
jgi:TIR domain